MKRLLIALSLALSGCYPAGPAVPLDLQATNISYSLNETQAAYSYSQTQTPLVATQNAAATQGIITEMERQTQVVLAIQQTQQALRILADSATATQVANATRDAREATATQAAREATATMEAYQGYLTQQALQVTATQTALDLERTKATNLALGWTPFVVAGIIAVFIWRFVVVYENRRSAYTTPSGEVIFNRRYSIPVAILMAWLRKHEGGIAFDDFVMPARAPGHGVRDNGEGYHASKDKDTEAQLRIIQQEQIRRLAGPSLPDAGLLQLPAYTDILEAGAIDIIDSDSREIGAWIQDVEEAEE